jgi:hypothetical protein
VHTLAEFGSYAYTSGERAKRDPAEEPVKQGDHAMEALRSALHGELAELWRWVMSKLGDAAQGTMPRWSAFLDPHVEDDQPGWGIGNPPAKERFTTKKPRKTGAASRAPRTVARRGRQDRMLSVRSVTRLW